MSPDNLLQIYPPLTPKLAPWMRQVVKNPSFLTDLLQQYGSPVNLHHLGPFAQNYKALSSVLDKHGVQHTIFFARKANKCRAFAREAQRLGFGVDTASYRELKQCLELGCHPRRLVLTAAVKSERLIRLAAENEIAIMMDNEDECKRLNRRAKECGKCLAVGIRISGFSYKEKKLYSRFGFDINEVADFIDGRFSEFKNIKFGGFHFHLNGYSIAQRGAALLQTMEQIDALAARGISASFIDMGGGLLVNYLADQKQWDVFWKELRRAVRGEREPVTFGNNGLGYEMVKGELQGAPDVYPYYNTMPKNRFLEAVLQHKNKNERTVASLMCERGIELRLEPGRSLLDQCGMTIARVIHRKKDSRGDWLVGLQINRSQLFSSSADFLVDPVFISTQRPKTEIEPTAVYFTGGFCLEDDLILKRKIVLPRLPQTGDIIGFPNTAGYMMHFYETESHLFKKSTNIVMNSGVDPSKKDCSYFVDESLKKAGFYS